MVEEHYSSVILDLFELVVLFRNRFKIFLSTWHNLKNFILELLLIVNNYSNNVKNFEK